MTTAAAQFFCTKPTNRTRIAAANAARLTAPRQVGRRVEAELAALGGRHLVRLRTRGGLALRLGGRLGRLARAPAALDRPGGSASVLALTPRLSHLRQLSLTRSRSGPGEHRSRAAERPPGSRRTPPSARARRARPRRSGALARTRATISASGTARWSWTLVETCARPRAGRSRPIARTPGSPPPDSRSSAAICRASSTSSVARSTLNATSGGRAVTSVAPVRGSIARGPKSGLSSPSAIRARERLGPPAADVGALTARRVGGERAVEEDGHPEAVADRRRGGERLGARRAAARVVEVHDGHDVDSAHVRVAAVVVA